MILEIISWICVGTFVMFLPKILDDANKSWSVDQ